MNNVLCIYHKSCMDGFGAAYAVWKKFPDAEFVAAHYGDTPPDVTGRDVIIVDFSYKRGDLADMCFKAKSVTVLDHHKTAIEDLEGFQHPNLDLVLDATRSGAVIAWQHFHADHVPQLLLHIQDRDLWKFDLPRTAAIHAYLTSQPFDFDIYDNIVDFIENDDFAHEIGEGRAILRIQDKQVATICSTTSKIILAGYEIEMVNCPGWLASEVGNELAKRNQFSLSYFDIPGKRVFSLRSVGDFDVSEIAKDHGGGGHKHAAGFTVPIENKATVPNACLGLWASFRDGTTERSYVVDLDTGLELFSVGNTEESRQLTLQIVKLHNTSVQHLWV